jgi:hypothetical protein
MVQSIHPLGERYAEKFHLSGRFTPEDEEMKRRALLKVSSEKYANRTDRLAKTENPWDNKKMKNPQIEESYGSVLKGLDETINEPE